VVEGPTAKCLKGQAVIGLYFSANWCQACSEFTPGLERLYTVQKARADKLEVVLVSRCREAKAMKYYSLTMPWLLMWHNANNKVKMKVRTQHLWKSLASPPSLLSSFWTSRGASSARKHAVG
jgi:hypothetical protein